MNVGAAAPAVTTSESTVTAANAAGIPQSQLNHIKKGRRLVRRRPLRKLVPAPSPQSSTLIVVITRIVVITGCSGS